MQKKYQVSQPSISYAIKRLEKQFNCQLVENDPSHRTFHLTPQGQILLEHIDTILPEIEAAKNRINHSYAESTSLGFPPLIMDFLARETSVFTEHSQVLKSIRPIYEGSIELLEMVKSGSLAGSFIGSLSPIQEDNLTVTPLFTSSLSIMVAKTHPLSSRNQVTFKEVMEEPFIILDEHFVHLNAFKQLNKKYHHYYQPLFQTGDLHLLQELVRQNVGISLLAGIALDKHENEIVKLELLPADQIEFHISFLQLADTQLPPQIQEFLNAVRESDFQKNP